MRLRLLATALLAGTALGASAMAQVGQGLFDLNQVPETTLATLPSMTPAIAKAVVARRPFATIVDANTFLLGQSLTQAQLSSLYTRAFVHLNLNAATTAEMLLIPRISPRMPREMEQYRPWQNLEQFDREIGKYVGAAESNRLKQYVFIPLDLNTAPPEMLGTIPALAPRLVREISENRPWTREKFDREIGRRADAKELARLWRFVVIR